MFEVLSPAGVIAAALIAPPGVEVIGALSRIDPVSLSDSAQVDLLVAWERQTAWLASRVQPALVAVGATVEALADAAATPHDSMDMPIRAAFAEIAAAVRISEVTAQDRLCIARALTGELSAVADVLAAGEITYAHARAIYDATHMLTGAQQAWVAARVLPAARRQTVTQLRRCLNRAVLAVEPRTAAARAKRAQQERTVQWWPLPDGMAELRLIASATDVMAVYRAADTLAKSRRRDLPPRGQEGWQPLDALRADALVALATGTATSATAGSKTDVHLTIDLLTLLGLRDRPAELAGYGPLPAPLARMLAADGKWRRLIYDSQTGALLDLGHTSYEPSAELARYIYARDAVCAFPTCNRTAAGCDLDHTRPYKPRPPGGRTDRNNLGPVCESHHRLKHETNWTLRRDPTTEQATWTSATGHQYPVPRADQRPFGTADLPNEPPPWIDNSPLPDTDDLEDLEDMEDMEAVVEADGMWLPADEWQWLNDPAAPTDIYFPYDDPLSWTTPQEPEESPKDPVGVARV
jgi:hypothetical protein